MLTDIHQKIIRDFGEQSPEAFVFLDELDALTKGLVSPRLVRGIIFLAHGNLERLESLIQTSRIDWRDVLTLAEYAYPDNRRLRDFDKTFYELGLLGSSA